jgi:hypothetical protein
MLVGRIFGSHGGGMPAGLGECLAVLINRFTKALGKSLPTLSEEELLWRLHFVVGAMLHMLTHGETLQRVSQGVAGAPSMEATLARFLSFAAAGLRDGVVSPQTDMAIPQGKADGHGRHDGEHDLDPVGLGANADGHAPSLEPAGEVALHSVEAGSDIDGHGALPEPDGEAERVQKPGKKRSRKAEQESPQVMFEF